MADVVAFAVPDVPIWSSKYPLILDDATLQKVHAYNPVSSMLSMVLSWKVVRRTPKILSAMIANENSTVYAITC